MEPFTKFLFRLETSPPKIFQNQNCVSMKHTVFYLFVIIAFAVITVSGQQIVRTPVTDAEITALGEDLWKLDNNNVANLIHIDTQNRAGRNGEDNARKPLLTIESSVYQKPTIAKLVKLLDNYVPATNITENVTPQETTEENEFLTAVLATPLMKKLEDFLTTKRLIISRHVGRNGQVQVDKDAFRNALRQIWFDQFARAGNVRGSSGFEHVFLGELRQGEVTGFHNWLYFGREEANGDLNYLGYVRVVTLGQKGMVLKSSFKWHGILKPVSDMFVGTSPELEMALYTLCYYARPGGRCPITLGGKSVPITAYFVNRYRKQYLSSAFAHL